MGIFENINEFIHSHETLFSIVSTMVPWFISAVLTVVQVITVVRRKMEKTAAARLAKSNESAPQRCVEKLVRVPYVPSDSVMKLLKILDNQDTGWDVLLSGGEEKLRFGSLSFNRYGGHVNICHNGTPIKFKSSEPDLDNKLLASSFSTRYVKERQRLSALENRKAEEALNKAHNEVEALLKNI